jgi:hypothetical protein
VMERRELITLRQERKVVVRTRYGVKSAIAKGEGFRIRS